MLNLKNSLTPRRKAILNIIVAEYIKTAMPVASETVLRNYQIGVSSATIRNDMAFLEKEGFRSTLATYIRIKCCQLL